MAKRFTCTSKWDEPWFRKLTPEQKCLWEYLSAKCDAAGVVDIDFDLAGYQIGKKVSDRDLVAYGERIVRLPNGLYLLADFITFQYGRLSENCRPHVPIMALVERHGLNNPEYMNGVSIPYSNPTGRVNTRQEKEQDQEQEEDKTPNSSCATPRRWRA